MKKFKDRLNREKEESNKIIEFKKEKETAEILVDEVKKEENEKF